MKLFSACLLTLILVACGSTLPTETVAEEFTISNLDSLAPPPSLDCSIAYYMVGRIKKMRINSSSVPFTVNVLHLDSTLYDQEIAIKIADTSHFEISYTKDNKRIISIGTFGKVCEKKNIGMLVFKTTGFEKIHPIDYPDFNYQFIVSKK